MNDRNGKAVVIGGGIIGTACAHYLAETGWQVSILERDGFGQGCSHGNCGFICPSHLLPLAVPGAVRKTLRSLLSRQSAISIRPRFDPGLWWWLIHFAGHCRHDTMLQSGRACLALLESSMTLYRELVAAEPLDCEWQSCGLLYVYQTDEEMEHFAETERLLREQFDVPAQRYDGDAVCQLEPALKTGLAGGWHYTDDTHLRPDKLLSAWRQRLESRGAEVREQCEALGLAREGRRVVAVETQQGAVPADVVIVAAGALSPRWSKQLGTRIPIQPGKGYSITSARPTPCPQIPLLFPEHKVAATPLASTFRLGSTMEFAGYDRSIRPARLKWLTDSARHYLQAPLAEPAEESWYGWRPMTYDGKPIIDRSPVLDNAYLAAGHNMLGMSMAPATGKLLAELINRQTPHVDPAPFSATRF